MRRLLTTCAGLCGLFAFLSGAWAWQTNINGSASAFDSARAAALDGAGNLVAAGVTSNSGPGGDFTVIKFHAISGLELWRRVINGSANSAGQANAVRSSEWGQVFYFDFCLNLN